MESAFSKTLPRKGAFVVVKNRRHNYYVALEEADKFIEQLIQELENKFGDEAANMARETAEKVMNAARLRQD